MRVLIINYSVQYITIIFKGLSKYYVFLKVQIYEQNTYLHSLGWSQ